MQEIEARIRALLIAIGQNDHGFEVHYITKELEELICLFDRWADIRRENGKLHDERRKLKEEGYS